MGAWCWLWYHLGHHSSLAPDTHDGNTDLEEYLVYFDNWLCSIFNGSTKAMILGLAVTISLEKQKFNFKVIWLSVKQIKTDE